LLLLPPLLPRLHSHSAALVRVCLLSLASSCSPTPFPRSHSPTPVRPLQFACSRSPAPVHLLLFTPSRSPVLVHPLSFTFTCPPSRVCPPSFAFACLLRVCLFAFVFARSCSCLPALVCDCGCTCCRRVLLALVCAAPMPVICIHT
jgi:hypothetical protein